AAGRHQGLHRRARGAPVRRVPRHQDRARPDRRRIHRALRGAPRAAGGGRLMKSGQIPGLVIATVTAVDDPLGQGRIKVTYPWLDESLESDWVPVAAPFAGPDRGLYMMPEVGDEMVAGFLHGDFNHPIVLGALWNGQSEVPSADPRQ